MNITQHNAATFAAGDTITLCDSGGVFRDAILTVPSSGSGTGANLITYNASGSPIVSGADLGSSGWSASAIYSTAWTAAAQTGGSASDDTGGAAEWRDVINGSAIGASGTTIKILYAANSASTVSLNGSSVGPRSGSTADYSAAPTRVTFNSGRNNVTLTANTTVWSDPITFTLSTGTNYLVDVELTAHERRWSGGSNLLYYVWSGGLEMTQVFGAAGNSGNQIYTVQEIDVAAQNVWQKALTTEPKQVTFNGALGIHVASASLVTSANQWFWGSSVLYVYSTSNPATAFTSPGIEYSQRNNAIDLNGHNYVTLQNIEGDGANVDGIYFSAASHDVTLSQCGASRNVRMGIHAATGYTTYNVTVDSCTVSWNGASGIRTNKGVHDWEISRNTVFRNSQRQDTTDDYSAYSAGIRLLEYWIDSSSTVYNMVVEKNSVYDNGKFVDGTYFVQAGGNIGGVGIWYDVIDDATGGNVIRYNNVYGNSYAQVQLEHNQNVAALYNVIHDSAPSTTGIWVDDYSHASTRYNRNNLIYGNTVYGNTWYGIRMSGASDSTANSCTGNVLKNNISTGNTLNTFFTEYGCQNDGTVGIGNVYLYNAFGTAATNFISWGGINISTYAAFDTAYGLTTHSVAGDPTFTNSAGGNFTLQSSSPAINTGMNLGATYVQGLNPVSSWPSSVKLLPQSQNSAGWDIGAYIFPKHCMACEMSQ